jgi:hypothetical protein
MISQYGLHSNMWILTLLSSANLSALYNILYSVSFVFNSLCGLVVKFLAANTEVPGSISGATKFLGLKRDPLSLVRINEEIPERKIAAPV